MSHNLLKLVIDSSEEKKAKDIKVLNIGEVSTIADYFVIMTGSSNTNIKAIADNIQKKVKDITGLDAKLEGYNEGRWVLLDYYDVVVHVFHDDERNFYNLEKLWADATVEIIDTTTDC